MHCAEPLGRRLPEGISDLDRAFFGQLCAVCYDGRVSLEGYIGGDFERSAQMALDAVKALAQPR